MTTVAPSVRMRVAHPATLLERARGRASAEEPRPYGVFWPEKADGYRNQQGRGAMETHDARHMIQTWHDIRATDHDPLMIAHANCKREGRSVLRFLADTVMAHRKGITPPSLLPAE